MSRAHFLHLPIQGDGTSDVEALSSYLLRQAALHTVGPGTLVRIMLDRLPDLRAQVDARAFRVPITAFIRPNATTEHLVEALSLSTGVPAHEFECMTFLATSQALHRPQGAFAGNLRWCPVCFKEWSESGRQSYFKLIWQLGMVDCCDIHEVKLRDSCPSCGAKQGSECVRDRLDQCHRCQAPLYKSPVRTDLLPSRFKELSALIEHIATHPGKRFPRAGVAGVVSKILDEAWHAESEDELFQVIPRDECVRFANPEEPVTIQAALRIAFWLRVPLVALLEGNVTGTTRPLLSVAGESLPDPIAPRKRGNRVKATEVAPLVSGAVRDAEAGSPVSLKALAQSAGVSVGYLRYRFPAWVNRIASHTREARQRAQTEVTHRIRAAVDDLEPELVGLNGGVLSRKAALKRTVTTTGLPKFRIRAEINSRVTFAAFAPAPPKKH
ncbi:hypothetical protein C7S18_17720 [Ahniella affigens]|uniref:TniQ domain-containing protein n=1 Tax=Ahniella affigens TaxID=2021234 RepID=A0A2P1PVM2_9GAMM|nr:TniQ family protein [Ahniella affigens]AVP98903.1 hypothetical protein C7S18_17720 [Ahniella affigens]